jgi:hypothetical protein
VGRDTGGRSGAAGRQKEAVNGQYGRRCPAVQFTEQRVRVVASIERMVTGSTFVEDCGSLFRVEIATQKLSHS